MKLGYLLIAVSFAANANCRVAGNDIVCDNSNALIETLRIINRQIYYPQPLLIINDPTFIAPPRLQPIQGIPPAYDAFIVQPNATNGEEE